MSVMDGNATGNMVMPVSPMGSGVGYGNDGGGLWWLLVLFLFAFGNNGWGGFGNNAGGALPYMLNNNTGNEVQRGFDQQAVMTAVNGINNAVTTGFGNIQTALCSGFGQAEISANARQMADMNQAFAAQTAMNQGFNGLQAQLAQCCCDNRMATVQTQNVVQSEGAATRAAIQEQTQAILDKMCQQEIDNLKAQNIALQNQVNMQNLAASQTAQTAAIVADNTAQTQYIVNRVAPYPIPAYIVQNTTTTTGSGT